MTQPKYRPAAYEKAKADRIIRRIARHKAAKKNPDAMIKVNGHVVHRRQSEASCAMCPVVFTFTMTSRPHRFCPACKVLRQQARDKGRKR
jgi:hypothetical protein